MKRTIVALRGMVVLPQTVVHFDASRPRSIAAVEAAMEGDKILFVSAQRDPDQEEPKQGDLFETGCLIKLRQMIRLPGGSVRVLGDSLMRAELSVLYTDGPYLTGEVLYAPRLPGRFEEDANAAEALRRVIREETQAYAKENHAINEKAVMSICDADTIEEMLTVLSANLPFSWQDRQALLEASTGQQLCDRLRALLRRETHIQQIKNELQGRVKEELDQNQKEYVLREQMKVIHQELGDEDIDAETDDFAEKIRALPVEEEVREKLMREVKMLRSLGSNSQEAYVHRTYLETVLELPWGKETPEDTDIRRAKEILDRDHYGLEDVKDRVLEHLAVRKLSEGRDRTILCFVGPPGTGKTSVARSIAESLGRKYVRVCLGGVRDEAEIRGHRKTYLGSMPGRIADGLRQAGSMNPLMLLDEIDKLGNDYKGDPSSALLEVLDGEQNAHFRDHYLEIPLDLSHVMFIATANTLETIPRPLIDRMEVIEVSGYTANEKLHIAQEHLADKQRKLAGLTPEQFTLTDDAVRALIAGYTREAGVRNLERRIGELCRKTARRLLEAGDGSGEEAASARPIEASDLEDLLGPARYHAHTLQGEDEVGIVHGLAWTQVGGDMLEIEVSVMDGTGKLQLTGKLGDVMKESAQIALSYVRSIAGEYGIGADFFDHHDLHVHVPEGAVPKDGPSAGITIATAILSAVSGRRVRSDVAMTGEVTLRGRVLPIGGLKEKLLAAKAAGIREVLMPEENRPDAGELSDEITEGLTLTYVGNMSQVASSALLP